jgi:uncharacterized protein (TIGR02996 family)
MLGLYVYLGRERSKRFEIPKQAVAIGSHEQNDLVLRDGEVAPFHCRLIFSRNRWFLAPPEEGGAAMTPLDDGAEVVAGAYRIVLALEGLRRDPVEQSLLDQIVAGDQDSRLVYADWLEGRGDAVRAEFLRLQQTLSAIDPNDGAARPQLRSDLRRLRELAGRLDREWRQLVGRPVVEGCRRVTFDFACRMDWGTLAPTDRPDVRHCSGCGDDVYYARSVLDARHHARRGRCVAVDLAEERRPDDLQDRVPLAGYVT